MSSKVKLNSPAKIMKLVNQEHVRSDLPSFRTGDTIKVHSKIVEGNKERIQVFEGVVLKKAGRNSPTATFTVRKVSYDVGVERTFLVNSPRIAKIDLVSKGHVRRSRLFYLRPLRGKAAKVKTKYFDATDTTAGSFTNHDNKVNGKNIENKSTASDNNHESISGGAV